MPGPVTRSGHRVLIAVVLATLAGAVAIVRPGATSADQTSPLLAPYQDRLQQATDRALEFLAKSQLPDGSFPTEKNDTAVTSLSVMAFLACGHTPGQGPYGEVINRGIDIVLASQQPNGLLVRDTIASGPMYSHGASTLMLLEVSGMVDPARQARIDEALAKALKLILAAQSIPKDEMNKGGWRYQPTSGDSDISCTGWQLMSLRSARNNGALVPTEAIEEGVKYILKCRHESGGFTYQPGGGPGLARTGTALLSLELCGRHGDRTTLAAGEWILQNLPPGAGQGEFFYYSLYYCSQGMFQLGDKYWEGWAQRMYDIMLASHFLELLAECTRMVDYDGIIVEETVPVEEDALIAGTLRAEEAATGVMEEVQILQIERTVVGKTIVELLFAYADIVDDERAATDMNAQTIKERVRRTKDKEKEIIVEGFDVMTKEQRETEKFFKDHRIGDWNVGMQKGLRQYVKDTYDREREEMEQQQRKERQLSRRDFVSDMQREIFLDGDAERDAAQMEAEEYSLRALPTDDDYGDADDGGALDYEDVNARDE